MRARALPILGLPLLLTYCGARGDLLLGEVALVSESGSSGSAGSSTGAEPSAGGSLAAGNGGAGGSGAATAGDGGLGGEPVATAGAGGESGDCVYGELPAVGSLVHRYNFDGTGTTLVDLVGGPEGDGELVGSGFQLTGSGELEFTGVKGRYVSLPNGLVSGLDDLTIVTWVTWTGGSGYQRIFDFGISDKGEAIGGSGVTYFAVIPLTGFVDNTVRGLGAEIKSPGMDTIQIASYEMMEDRPAVISFVFKSAESVALYLDAVLLGEAPTTLALSDIQDVNNWLGQSQWDRDPSLRAIFTEFRVYEGALNRCQLASVGFDGKDTPRP